MAIFHLGTMLALFTCERHTRRLQNAMESLKRNRPWQQQREIFEKA
jgi:hypothetical protein